MARAAIPSALIIALAEMISPLAACDTQGTGTEFRFVQATINDVQTSIRSGMLHCAEFVSRYLARIGDDYFVASHVLLHLTPRLGRFHGTM